MTNLFETVRTEDFVEYFLFPVDNISASHKNLQEIYDLVLSFVTPFTENYIWQKDEFNLIKVTKSDSDDFSPHLHGIVHYGENVEDEWFVVYLLLSFSEVHDDVFIRIVDSDDEFLLIEAADILPKWMKAENCNNRVFIHKGIIRILPTDVMPNSNSVREVIDKLSHMKSVSDLELAITKIIKRKIKDFTGNLNHFLHKSRVYLPAKIAALLDVKPSLIAPAITAFCQRDPIDVKICRKMENFPPNDMVMRLVTFTKFLYAMISHQKLERNRSSWNLPPQSDPNFKEHCLGYKITCGFEILTSKCNKSESDLSLNKKWVQYVEVLKRKGYFSNLMEGSKNYTELEKKARLYFLDNVKTNESQNNYILNIIQTIKCDFNKMKREESELPLSDDEKWMEIDENELNKLLEEQFGLRGIDVTNSPQVLSGAIYKFLNSTSDIEGVELKNDKDANFVSGDMDVDDEDAINAVSFNPDDFIPSVEKMLDVMELHNKNTTSMNEFGSDLSDSSEEDDNESENIAEDLTIKSYMDLMDKELQSSVLSKSFISKSDEDETVKPVDVDTNMLTNMLKSYEQQYGGSGPAGNLLHSLGFKLQTKKSS